MACNAQRTVRHATRNVSATFSRLGISLRQSALCLLHTLTHGRFPATVHPCRTGRGESPAGCECACTRRERACVCVCVRVCGGGTSSTQAMMEPPAQTPPDSNELLSSSAVRFKSHSACRAGPCPIAKAVLCCAVLCALKSLWQHAPVALRVQTLIA